MNLTEDQKNEIAMFGMTIENMEIDLSMALSDMYMIATSILSDAQEQMRLGFHEQARQSINRAKFVITHHWPQTPRK